LNILSSSNPVSRRRLARHRISVPLDVSVQRDGTSDSFPGRSANLCEQGIAVVLAGDVVTGDEVAIALQLPHLPVPLRMRAVVRHHNDLSCGMEFVAPNHEQQAVIRAAQSQINTETPVTKKALTSHDAEGGGSETPLMGEPHGPRLVRRNAFWIALLALTAIFAGILWFRWNRAWAEIEAGLPSSNGISAESPRVQVDSEVMQRLLIHRVDPEYPEVARRARVQSVIVLDIVVGRDGSVVGMRPMNGPDVLARAAMDALRWWKFEPYRMNGEPAVVETTVTMEFKP
jgi:TonB family protein